MDQALGAPRVAVHGETPIARAVVSLGRALGYDMVPFDATALGGAAAVVLACHGGPGEDPALRAALNAAVPYIGIVARRARGEAVLARLDLDAPTAARIHTPAGLDIGARTPEEVALAILAEIVGSRPREPGQSRAARGKTVCNHRPPA